MILRATALGFILWVANFALFRFAGQYFFFDLQDFPLYPLALMGATALIGALMAFILLKLMREAPGDEGEAAISIAFPSLLLNALLCHEFASVFPNLDEGRDGIYGAMAMIYAAAMLFIGLMMTRLAPKDERL